MGAIERNPAWQSGRDGVVLLLDVLADGDRVPCEAEAEATVADRAALLAVSPRRRGRGSGR